MLTKWLEGVNWTLGGRFGHEDDEERRSPSKSGEQLAARLKRREAIAALRRYVSASLAAKLYDRYGEQAPTQLKRNPYRLALDLDGVSFRRVDRIALTSGLVQRDARLRLESGIHHILQVSAARGNVYAPRADVVRQTARLLRLAPASVDRALNRLDLFGLIVVEGERVYPRALHRAELDAAQRLYRLLTHRYSRLAAPGAAAPKRIVRRADEVRLWPDQRKALKLTQVAKVSLLVGEPGAGKTTTVRALLNLLKKSGHRFELLAATSEAASQYAPRLEERVQTVSEWVSSRVVSRRSSDADLVIVLEASQLDLLFLDRLLAAIDPAAHLILVGDPAGVVASGAGQVLRDLSDSGIIPCTRLEKQKEKDKRKQRKAREPKRAAATARNSALAERLRQLHQRAARRIAP